jgi:hypothetical protein
VVLLRIQVAVAPVVGARFAVVGEVVAVAPVVVPVVPTVPFGDPVVEAVLSAVLPAAAPGEVALALPVAFAPGALIRAFRSSYVPFDARSRHPVSTSVSVAPLRLFDCSKSFGVVTPSLRAG